ncbi:MAG: hypothetical protein WBG37_02475, partial [Desulfobacterales bacterium]
LFDRWPRGCDLLHVHNPTLAKNRDFLGVLKILQQQGVRLFLQIHDFAEDGRPRHYFEEDYPENCHYGVINSRDYGLLRAAGLKPVGLHRIDNCVPSLKIKNDKHLPCNLVLYPVRAIPRKNIGEAILLSIFFPQGQSLAVTLPPTSKIDMLPYLSWQAFCRTQNLKVIFEAGLHHDFGGLMGGADFILSTSISEGFGFCFLEPWLAGKVVWGRGLPDICGDFSERGIGLNHLYNRLQVPLSWLDGEDFQQRWRAALGHCARRFKLPWESGALDRAWAAVTRGGRIDFGLLDEPAQRGVLARLLANGQMRKELLKLNLFLKHFGTLPSASQLIRRNAKAIARHYSLARYGERLQRIYAAVSGTPVAQRIVKSVLLNRFLVPERFSLLKWRGDDG